MTRNILFSTVFSISLLICSPAECGNVIKGLDFDVLFSSPTKEEIEETLNDWKERLPSAEDCRIEGERIDKFGNRILIISHLVDGFRHYGGVVVPKLEYPEKKLPIHIRGNFLNTTINTKQYRAKRDFIYLRVAYRGESIEDEEIGFFRCEGKSENGFLQDVFDSVTFLEAVKKLVPNADTKFIITEGLSRNCSTALFIGLFAPGTRAVLASAGWCDMFADYIKEGAMKIFKDYDTASS